jgi:hypothetical protein
MLSQDIIQVYANEEGDAVIVVGRFQGYGISVDPEIVCFDMADARAIARALMSLAEAADQELE